MYALDKVISKSTPAAPGIRTPRFAPTDCTLFTIQSRKALNAEKCHQSNARNETLITVEFSRAREHVNHADMCLDVV